MAEESKTPTAPTPTNPPAASTPAAKPFKFNELEAVAKIKEVEDYLQTFAGQKAHNPFIVIAKEITPLKVQYNNGVRTEELYNKIMALKKEAPVIPMLVANHAAQEVQDKARAVPTGALPAVSGQKTPLNPPK